MKLLLLKRLKIGSRFRKVDARASAIFDLNAGMFANQSAIRLYILGSIALKNALLNCHAAMFASLNAK